LNSQSTQRQTWLKAAVIGSLWASLEIVIGSFLHNIHMPFAGTILGFFSLSLLIAFHQKWQDKGLILRAGIIAALMRSLSPSAIIIGPMVGIFLEGLFLDGAIRIFGKNKLGYFFGAFAALSSNLLQKVVSILIFYGFDIVVVLENMYHYALKQLHFPSLKLNSLVAILLGMYGAVALITVYLGNFAGKKALLQTNEMLEIEFVEKTNLFVSNPNRKKSIWLLFIHFSLILVGLFILGYTPYYFSIPAIISYVILVNYKYPNSFKRLSKPKFWFQLFVIIIFAALFFNGFNSKEFLNTKGLLAGLIMSFRAILLVTAFTAISFELRNPVVKAVLYKKGFSQLYISLGLAFGALPSLLNQLIKPKVLLKSPTKQIAHLINFSDNLLQAFQQEAGKDQKIMIISGKQRQGKTTFLKEVIVQLKRGNISFDGIIAEGIDVDGQRKGFNLVHLKSNKTYPLATTTPTPNFSQYGRFYFDETIFTKVNSLLQNTTSDFLIIDEIGPLEMQNKGWATTIEKLLETNTPMIWVVRKSLLAPVTKHWQISQAQVFDIGKYTPEKVVNAIKKQL
jgi:nucleoside-triphosphatase THEP1